MYLPLGLYLFGGLHACMHGDVLLIGSMWKCTLIVWMRDPACIVAICLSISGAD